MSATAGAVNASPAKQRKLNPPRLSESWRRRLPLLPALLIMIVLTQVPFVMSIYYSFTDWHVVPPEPRNWIGLDNYRHLIHDHFFGQGFVRTLLITPFLLMPVVVGLVWKNQMFNDLYGVINWVIEKLGGSSVDFVSRHPTMSIAVTLIWQWTPFMMLIMLAGLQSQPADVLEAAKVDGASAWGTFRQLTLSHLRPYMELGILLGTIYLIQVYDLVAVMTGGGPGSTNVPYFVFQRSIGGGWEFGQASSYSIVVVIFSIIIATVSLRVLSGLLKGEEAA
jgi:sorbitol/mannitol transport system permease protein